MRVPGAIARRIADTRSVAIYGGSAILVLLLPLITIIHGKAQRPHSIDFVAFYVSGLQFRDGKDVYARMPFDVLDPISPESRTRGRDMHANLNPPASVLLLAPLARLPFAYAYWTWSLVSLFCMATTAWLLASGYVTGPRRFAWSIGILSLILAYSPTWLAVSLGQLTFFVFLLLAAGWRLIRVDNERAAGAILGATFAVKPFIGVLAIVFLAGGHWRPLAWFGGGFAVANLVALAFMGPSVFLQYINTLRDADWHSHIMNASIYGGLVRLSGSALGTPASSVASFPQILWLAACALLLGSLALLYRRLLPWTPKQGTDIAFAYSLVLMLLISPLGWIYYFPILLICVLVLFSETRDLAGRRLLRLAATAGWLASGLLSFPFVGNLLPGWEKPPLVIGDIYLAVLVLFAAMLLGLGRSIYRSGA